MTQKSGTNIISILSAKLKDFVFAYIDLLKLPLAFWLIIALFTIDSMAYFGVLTLMTAYCSGDIGLSDQESSIAVSIFTGFVTLFMIGAGGFAERLGVRRGLNLALLICLVGRLLYMGAPQSGGSTLVYSVLFIGLVFSALGEGILQPLSYSGIKQYTDEKTNAMGYGVIYAMMNFGIVMIGLISPLVRVPVNDVLEARHNGGGEAQSFYTFLADTFGSGINAVNGICVALTGVALIMFFLLMSKRVEANKLRPEDEVKKAKERAEAADLSWVQRVMAYFKDGPFSNPRFLFFIFMLLPVQTLFAHQWLTMPLYVIRAYPEGVGDRMEWIVNWINPGIIFFGVPIATALTRRTNVYTMMMIGTAVSALPTFLLTTGPNLTTLITYLVIFSIGEALWQPRFLQYAAELAPEGKVAQYMGLANVPWITAKMTTGLYSGWMLSRYCPETGPKDTETMWLLYAFIALASPIGLLLGRKWVMAGWDGKPKEPASATTE